MTAEACDIYIYTYIYTLSVQTERVLYSLRGAGGLHHVYRVQGSYSQPMAAQDERHARSLSLKVCDCMTSYSIKSVCYMSMCVRAPCTEGCIVS